MADETQVEEPTREFPALDESQKEPAPVEAAPRKSFVGRLLAFVAVVFVVIVAACFGLRAAHVLPTFSNPFATQTTDRSQPVLLQSMRDLSRYVAADGTFQVIVDLQQDKKNIPDFLLNDRTLFVGSGSVEAYVDFSTIADGALVVNNTDKSVQITLPAPQQSQANLDLQRSYVVAEQRGLLNRIADAFRTEPSKQQNVYAEAQKRITEAAASSGLDQRARDNTEKMLQSLLTRLGYTTVTVKWSTP